MSRGLLVVAFLAGIAFVGLVYLSGRERGEAMGWSRAADRLGEAYSGTLRGMTPMDPSLCRRKDLVAQMPSLVLPGLAQTTTSSTFSYDGRVPLCP